MLKDQGCRVILLELAARLFNRPTAVGVNGGVNLSHEADGFGRGHHNFLIVVKVCEGEGPAFAVLEPFMTDMMCNRQDLI